jgi:septal ring factor EnvC (AmiA/AmiB activator)
MKIQIDIDDDQLDKAFQENLKWHIDTISKDLLKLTRSKNKLEKYQIEEKEHLEKLLPALKIVGEYFGVK